MPASGASARVIKALGATAVVPGFQDAPLSPFAGLNMLRVVAQR